MANRQRAKKFFAEPFLWVGVAMVGVVLMGPSAANLAKKITGTAEERDGVDEHGEPIVGDVKTADSLDATGNVRVAQATGTPEATVEPSTKIPAVEQPVQASVERNNRGVSADTDRSKSADEELAAIDRELQKRRSDPTNGTGFDVDSMIEEIEAEVSGAGSNSGSGTEHAQSPAEPSQTSVEPAPTSSRPSTDVESVKRKVTQDITATEEPTHKESPQPATRPDRVAKRQSEPETETVPESETEKPAPPEDTTTRPLPPIENKSEVPTEEPATDSDDMQDGALPSDSDSPNDSDDDADFSPDEDDTMLLGPALKFRADDRGEPDPFDFDQSAIDAIDSVPVEHGDTWWEENVGQQFWPERQAQYANLDAVVFAALQHSAQVQILNDTPRIEQTFVREQVADFDWSAFVDASWNSINEPVRSELQTGSRTGRFTQDELSVGTGLQKRLAGGGDLRVANTYGTLDNNSIFLAPPDQGSATFSLDYRQPLMRGRGKEISQSQIVLAKLNVQAHEGSARKQVQEYVFQVVSAYWELYRARGILAQRHQNVVRAREIFRRLASHADSATGSQQVIRANAAAAARQSELIDAEYAVANAQDRLINLTHGNDMPNSGNLEIVPVDAPPAFEVPYDMEMVTQLAIQNRPEVKVAFSEIKAASMRQVIAFDELKPQLDAIISSYVVGVQGDKNIGHAYYNQFSAGDPSYSVGMAFEVPLGRRAANAKVHRRELEQRLLQNRLRQTLGDVALSARTAFRDVYRLGTIVENNRNVVSQAANELNSIEKQRGLLAKQDQSASLFLNDLLSSQQRLADAEQRLMDSQAELAIAYVALKRATGELLKDGSCSVEESSYEVAQTSYEQIVEPPSDAAYGQASMQGREQQQLLESVSVEPVKPQKVPYTARAAGWKRMLKRK